MIKELYQTLAHYVDQLFYAEKIDWDTYRYFCFMQRYMYTEDELWSILIDLQKQYGE